jgi:hypothetical protein
LKIIFAENLVEHDFDVVAGVPVADALSVSALLRRDKPRVLADRQVSPTVLSSNLFRHAAILRGKSVSVNFRLCSRRRFTLTRQVASTRQAAFTRRARARRGRSAVKNVYGVFTPFISPRPQVIVS